LSFGKLGKKETGEFSETCLSRGFNVGIIANATSWKLSNSGIGQMQT
jgi:hypothetical protein